LVFSWAEVDFCIIIGPKVELSHTLGFFTARCSMLRFFLISLADELDSFALVDCLLNALVLFGSI